MRIGIDCTQIQYKGTGVARFTKGFTESILKASPKHEWIFFFSSFRNSASHFFPKDIPSHISIRSIPIPVTMLNQWWNTIRFPNIERITGKLDWFISSDWIEPPSKCKKATIIHDLAYIRYPETVKDSIIAAQKNRMQWVQKESNIIFTDSKATRDDCIRHLSISAEKLHVIYPGVETLTPSKKYSEKIQKKYHLKRFILCVGKQEPRKNIPRLLKAYQSISNTEGVELVIVGQKGWGENIVSSNTGIRFLGFVDDNTLSSLYTLCEGFVYPSIWEGFGYPPLEAMQFTKPVALSNSSSLAEIGKDVAIMFNPFSIKSIQQAIETLINNKKVKKELSILGKKRSDTFTWQRYYNQCVDILEKESL